MVTHLEFAIFTLAPMIVMGAALVYASLISYKLNDYRPLLLIALLALMTSHQMTEILQYNSDTFYQTTSPVAESFETGANLLASLATYLVLGMLREERERRTKLTEKTQELAEFRQATEAAGLAVVITDEDGIIQYVNPAFEGITGHADEEVLGNSLVVLYPSDHEHEYLPNIMETVQEGDAWQGEVIKKRSTGEFFVASQTTSPIFDEYGKVHGIVSIFRDTTDQRQKDQYLQILERVLRHNLRNQLNIIAGETERLQDSHRSSAESTALDHIETASDELLQLVNHSSVISQILEEGKREQPLDALLEDVRMECQNAHPGATIRIADDIASATVDDRIKPALVELCDNAVKHGDGSSPVEITVQTHPLEDDFIDVAVTDQGPGIPEQEKTVLQQGRETPLKHGSGLGLWLVHLAATTAGGRISISTNDSQGSTVTLSIPQICEA